MPENVDDDILPKQYLPRAHTRKRENDWKLVLIALRVNGSLVFGGGRELGNRGPENIESCIHQYAHCTVHKMNTTLRQRERISKTQTLIARKFMLQALGREACKFTL
jgi:hypothetical protein